MRRRRTFPSREKWRPMADSVDRCLRCGCWPGQRLLPGSVRDANFRWCTVVCERGYRQEMTLCPTCAGRVPVDLLLHAGWPVLRQWWPVGGRRVPDVVPVATAEMVNADPAIVAAAARLPGEREVVDHPGQ